MQRRRTLIAGLSLGAVLLVSGCSQKYSAERDGKKIGEAVCDLRTAGNAEAAASARADIEKQFDDLARKYSIFTAEDRRDVQKNLADLAEHSIQGNDLLRQQDLAVLERSARHIAEDSNEVSRAAWEGFVEGTTDCTS